jgi:hypothetical protein
VRLTAWRYAALAIAVMFMLTASMAVAAEPRLIFTKSFPGSQPAYVWIAVDRTGALEFKEAPDDDQPVKAVLLHADTSQLFDLAGQLSYFKTPIESGLKVANMGKKVFRYEPDSGPASEAAFNYSVIPAAQQLLDLFEKISSTEQAWIDLDRTVHFDKLGVNDALARVESLWLGKELMAPQQFLPLLRRIKKQDAFMHLARERAARLADAIEPQSTQASGGAKETENKPQ